jgi:hypothetical protein
MGTYLVYLIPCYIKITTNLCFLKHPVVKKNLLIKILAEKISGVLKKSGLLFNPVSSHTNFVDFVKTRLFMSQMF